MVNISGASQTLGAAFMPVAPAPASASVTATTPSADLSLVIEDYKAAGEMGYKTINRATGAVVNQYPDQQLVRMRENSAYAPGEVIRQSA